MVHHTVVAYVSADTDPRVSVLVPSRLQAVVLVPQNSYYNTRPHFRHSIFKAFFFPFLLLILTSRGSSDFTRIFLPRPASIYKHRSNILVAYCSLSPSLSTAYTSLLP